MALNDHIKEIANGLVLYVGFAQAVQATDIKSAAAEIQTKYAEYSQYQISTKIADEIKKTHRPGISGSL